MDLVERWWNGWLDAVHRRDIWLTTDGGNWHVRARQGAADGPEVHYDYAQEWRARAMVDRLMKTAPARRWKNITDLVTEPHRFRPPAAGLGDHELP